MNDPRESEKGIVLPLTALLMMVLIGFLGLALDFGYMLIRGGQVQNVADAIALSCSGANYRSADSCVTGDTNVSNPTYVGSVDQYAFPAVVTKLNSIDCPVLGQYNCVKADVTTTWNTFFITLFGVNALTVSKSAVAGFANSIPCVLGLAPSGTNITFRSSSPTTFTCLLASNSTSSSSIVKSGSSTVTTTVGVITSGDVVGTIVSPYILTYQPPTADPFSSLIPPLATGTSPLTIKCEGGVATVNPGNYTSITINPPSNCTVTVMPGVYTANATISLSGSGNIVGSGVLFYQGSTTAGMDISTSGSLTLSAPTTGANAGLLFWQRSTNSSALEIGGNGAYDLQGDVYAPVAAFAIKGTRTVKLGTVVVGSIDVRNSASYSYTGQGSPLYRSAPTLIK